MSNANPYVSMGPRSKANDVEETSSKKYPHTKYYQFQDEDSSGRKYIKDTLHLWTNDANANKENKPHFNLDKDYQKYCEPILMKK